MLLLAALAPACRCDKTPEGAGAQAADAETAAEGGDAGREVAAEPVGLSAPIAAARVEGGDIVVAGLDVPAKAIRVQRLDANNDAVVADRTVLDALKWSSEADLKIAPAGKGVAITWRGLRAGRLVRQLVVLAPDLAPKGEAVEVTAASCVTQDAVWYTDGRKAFGRAWAAFGQTDGQATKLALPGEADVSLVCGAHRAWAVLDEDDGASFVALGDGGAARDAGSEPKTRLFDEAAFGEDDARERGEFSVGEDLGIVRLATSGAVALREVRAGVLGPVRKLKTVLPRDADVVAVDASSRAIAIVYTDDVVDACADAGGGATARIAVLRVDRGGEGEETFELSPGTCGREVGPFFTGAVGDAVSIAWVERIPVAGQARAPIAGLAYRTMPAQGAPGALARIDQPADALVDAGCDSARCYAVALARREGMDAMVPGVARVVRYP
jgi:hypothetical protein